MLFLAGLSLRSFRHHEETTDKHNLSVHLLPLTRKLVLCKPGSMRKAVPNGLRTPTLRALPDIKVLVRTVRPAAQTIPLSIVTLVFMVRSVAQTRSYCSTGTSLFMLRSVAQIAATAQRVQVLTNLTLDKSCKAKLRNLAILAFIVQTCGRRDAHFCAPAQ